MLAMTDESASTRLPALALRGRSARLSAAVTSAPTTKRNDHDCDPWGSSGAPAQIPLGVGSSRSFTKLASSGSVTTVADGMIAPIGNVNGSATFFGQSIGPTTMLDMKRLPAPRTVPAGRAVSWRSSVPRG